jgi:hypothetical protein
MVSMGIGLPGLLQGTGFGLLTVEEVACSTWTNFSGPISRIRALCRIQRSTRSGLRSHHSVLLDVISERPNRFTRTVYLIFKPQHIPARASVSEPTLLIFFFQNSLAI